jgi:dihydrodipicolinate synthase/N-acetylneuraminate lyase
VLIDAGALIGAHGAIPATGNVAPAAAAEAWDAAAAGDWKLAERAQEIVGEYENLANIAQGGSPDAASYSSMKATLREWGIFDGIQLTRPLRGFTETELNDLRARLATLPHGGKRVALAA